MLLIEGNMDKNEFRKYDIDEDHYLRAITINEILSGQEKEQILGLYHQMGKEFPVDLENVYICVTGLGNRLYHNYYHCKASVYMNIFASIKSRIQEYLTLWDCKSDIRLYYYGQKQIVVLFSTHKTLSSSDIARQIAYIVEACYEQRLYGEKDKIHPWTVYCDKISEYEQIYPTFQRMIREQKKAFFDNHSRVHALTAEDFQHSLPSYSKYTFMLDELKAAMIQKNEELSEYLLKKILLEEMKKVQDFVCLEEVAHEIKNQFYLLARTYGCSIDDIEECFNKEKYFTIEQFYRAVASYQAALFSVIRNYPKLSTLIQKVVSYIHANLEQELTLNQIAKEMHVVPNYLSRKFNDELQINLPNYITRQRIEKACEYLEKTELKIIDISILCGIDNAHYFTELFKKQMGVTPSEYRKSVK